MKKLKFAAIALVSVVLIAVGSGFLLPSQWHVVRAVVVNTPPSVVYPFIANLKSGWPQWSEFDKEDPAITYTYSGPGEGVGAKRSWVSKKMGDGFQVITKGDPSSGVEFDLEMPAEGMVLHGRITMASIGNTTLVSWLDYGDVGMNPFRRWFAYFMDKFLGETFERSLAALKQKAEARH